MNLFKVIVSRYVVYTFLEWILYVIYMGFYEGYEELAFSLKTETRLFFIILFFIILYRNCLLFLFLRSKWIKFRDNLYKSKNWTKGMREALYKYLNIFRYIFIYNPILFFFILYSTYMAFVAYEWWMVGKDLDELLRDPTADDYYYNIFYLEGVIDEWNNSTCYEFFKTFVIEVFITRNLFHVPADAASTAMVWKDLEATLVKVFLYSMIDFDYYFHWYVIGCIIRCFGFILSDLYCDLKCLHYYTGRYIEERSRFHIRTRLCKGYWGTLREVNKFLIFSNIYVSTINSSFIYIFKILRDLMCILILSLNVILVMPFYLSGKLLCLAYGLYYYVLTFILKAFFKGVIYVVELCILKFNSYVENFNFNLAYYKLALKKANNKVVWGIRVKGSKRFRLRHYKGKGYLVNNSKLNLFNIFSSILVAFKYLVNSIFILLLIGFNFLSIKLFLLIIIFLKDILNVFRVCLSEVSENAYLSLIEMIYQIVSLLIIYFFKALRLFCNYLNINIKPLVLRINHELKVHIVDSLPILTGDVKICYYNVIFRVKYNIICFVYFILNVFIRSPLCVVYCFSVCFFLLCLSLLKCNVYSIVSFFICLFLTLYLMVLGIREGLRDFSMNIPRSTGTILCAFLVMCFSFLIYLVLNGSILYFIYNPNYFTGWGVRGFNIFLLSKIYENSFAIGFISLGACYILIQQALHFSSLESKGFKINVKPISWYLVIRGHLTYNWICYSFSLFWMYGLLQMLFAPYSLCEIMLDHLFFFTVLPPFGISFTLWVLFFRWLGSLREDQYKNNLSAVKDVERGRLRF